MAESSRYINADFDERANYSYVLSAQELARTYSQTHEILDLGCADGPVFTGLPDFNIHGIDIDASLVELAKQRFPSQDIIQANVCSIDFNNPAYGQVDTILMLDVLHLLKRSQTLQVLQNLRQSAHTQQTIIALAPVVSALSIETWNEAWKTISDRRRPEAGLLGTHCQTIGTASTYARLFQRSGYEIVERYRFNRTFGPEGTWQWHDTHGLSQTAYLERSSTGPLSSQIARLAIKSYLHGHETGNQRIQGLSGIVMERSTLFVAQTA